MVGSAALYQVAVALIPALLFGGATLQLRDDSPSLSGNRFVVAFVLLIIFAGLLAEIVAIKGAIDPNLSDIEQRYLVLVLTLGTAGVAFWIAAPLLTKKDAQETPDTRNATGNNATGKVKWLKDHVPQILLAMALAVIGVLGQFAITDSLDDATALAQYDEIAEQRVRIEREQRAAEGNDSDARAHLIALARSTAAAAPAVHVVLSRLAWLDSRALGAARNGDIDMGNVDQRMKGAFRVLENTDGALKRIFEHRVDGLDLSERELLLLAEARMISAVRAEMVTEVNETISLKRLEGACESVGLGNCRPGAMKRTTVFYAAPTPALHAEIGLSELRVAKRRVAPPAGRGGSRRAHSRPDRPRRSPEPQPSEKPSFK